MKTYLITGSGGFIGGHLVEFLLGRGGRVCAVDQASAPPLRNAGRHYSFHAVDIMDKEALAALVVEARPDVIFHLAAQSYPEASWEKPALTFEVNVLGAINVMEAVKSAGLKLRIVMAGSSAEYAPVQDSAPIREDAPLDPSSPYGVSKLAMDQAARLYAGRHGLSVVVVRPFFVIGPRKRGDVCSDFARGIVAIERGEKKELPVGNLAAVRDLLDVRDGIEALLCAAEKGAAGEVYNICSGKGYSLREVLDIFKSMSKATIVERSDSSRLRKLDEPVRIGDPTKLMALGWRPRREIRETLKEILEYWRAEEER